MKVYGYIRVSSDKQTLENQRYEINKYCLNNSLIVSSFYEETITGVKDYSKRELGKLLKRLKEGDILIASELSRLGRSFLMIMEILSICSKKKIKVITIKDNFILNDTIESKVICFCFSFASEIERKLISTRTKEALEYRKKLGIKLGRPKGSKSIPKLEKFKDKIVKDLSKDKSLTSIARSIKCHRSTLYKYIKENNLK